MKLLSVPILIASCLPIFRYFYLFFLSQTLWNYLLFYCCVDITISKLSSLLLERLSTTHNFKSKNTWKKCTHHIYEGAKYWSQKALWFFAKALRRKIGTMFERTSGFKGWRESWLNVSSVITQPFVSSPLEFMLVSAVRIKFLRASCCHLLLAFWILPARFSFRSSFLPRRPYRGSFIFFLLFSFALLARYYKKSWRVVRMPHGERSKWNRFKRWR